VSSTPVVAVTATTEIIRDVLRVRVNAAYTSALEASGMLPLVVPPLGDAEAAQRVLRQVDGLLLTGGEDVDPTHYGASRHPALGEVHPARDAWELRLVAEARARRLPTLAICRGAQMLNVALGGTLVQDLPSELPRALAHDPPAARSARVHEVEIEPQSRLAAALGAHRVTVNSTHHQAIDQVGPVLRITARAPDGVAEGVETALDDPWWVLGVQWHPEELIATPEGWDRALFDAFRARMRTGTPATVGAAV
jgi:putative glutamine amidotransferase